MFKKIDAQKAQHVVGGAEQLCYYPQNQLLPCPKSKVKKTK
ncbi:hypothetical protein [Pseudomonas fluorescens]|nr:hypothetical protein [Pseudomonas fluorescens]